VIFIPENQLSVSRVEINSYFVREIYRPSKFRFKSVSLFTHESVHSLLRYTVAIWESSCH